MTDATKRQEYETARELAREARKALADLAKKKEFWFAKKEKLKLEIKETISALKELRTSHEDTQRELHSLKAERDRYNKEVQRVISELRALNKEKSKKVKDYQGKVNPKNIAKRIDELEAKVEVEVDFKREQKLMEQIKKLKKSYDEMQGVIYLADKTTSLTRELRDLKKKADSFHAKVQSLAKDSNYASFVAHSKRITSLKKTQEDAFAEFVRHKNLYQEAYKAYKNQLKALKKLKEKLGIVDTPRKHKTREDHKQQSKQDILTLKEKTKAVEEKIRKGEKLTTEDLLVFQGKEAA